MTDKPIQNDVLDADDDEELSLEALDRVVGGAVTINTRTIKTRTTITTLNAPRPS